MKTVLDIAKECGAEISDGWQEWFVDTDGILFKTESQLTATFDLCNRQNSEPIYQIKMQNEAGLSEWTDVNSDTYSTPMDAKLKRIVYLAPQQPQTVRDALEMAAQVCEELGEKHHALGKDNQNHMYISGGCDACDYAIRALINQPKPPAKELI